MYVVYLCTYGLIIERTLEVLHYSKLRLLCSTFSICATIALV